MVLAISCRTAVLRNNFQCLLLNILINVTRDIFQLIRNENTKSNHAGAQGKKFEEKVREKG